jgi:hypothetical protein
VAIPVGSIVNYSTIDGPDEPGESWFVCNGQLLKRSEHLPLFGVIGGLFGDGDAQTTFALPDLRGYFVRGANTSPAGSSGQDPEAAQRQPMAAGGSEGDKVGSVQPSAFREHAHQISTEVGETNEDGDTQAKIWNRGTWPEGWLTNPSNAPSYETRPINAAFSFVILAAESSLRFPVGSIIGYGGAGDPPVDQKDGDQWLICDGRAVSGGPPLPDLRGWFLRGKDSRAGTPSRDPEESLRTDPYTGQASTAVGSVQPDQFEAHRHVLNGWYIVAPQGGSSPLLLAVQGSSPNGETDLAGQMETRPINAYLHYIMRVA